MGECWEIDVESYSSSVFCAFSEQNCDRLVLIAYATSDEWCSPFFCDNKCCSFGGTERSGCQRKQSSEDQIESLRFSHHIFVVESRMIISIVTYREGHFYRAHSVQCHI